MEFYFKENIFRVLSFKTKDAKKAKTENKGESEEENAKTPKETENNVEKPDNDEDDSEVPSLPLGLTGNVQEVF